MKYRRLGKTDLNVSVVGVGTWQFGGEWGKDFQQADVEQILATAKNHGINLIDTAECYGDHLSESLIGKSLANKRQDWIIATKFGHKFHGLMDRTYHWSPEEVVQQLEASLRALKTDYVDIYQFHSGPDEAFDNDDLWDTLNRQVEMGKIRHLGISIGKNDNVYQTDKASQINAKVIQVVYNRLDQRPEEKVLPSCQKQDLGVLARVPLASGLLTGKYSSGATFAANDVRHTRDKEEMQRRLKLVDKIKEQEVPSGVNMAQWALAWCLKNPAVTSVIPGCKSVEQVISNAKAAEMVE